MDDKYISKLYRYEALLQAVDFFTQKFNLEQIALYAVDFANEILTLNSSALFFKDGDIFRLKKTRNYEISEYEINDTYRLQCIATFLGDVIQSDFERFFNIEDIKAFHGRVIIPLLIHDKVYGFIISDGKAIGELDEDDYNIARALMRLINNSLENSKIFSELQEKNIQLDQKIFNLFSINQSSRALLSELNLEKLFSLSLDIFSELTSSQITSFGIYDEIRKKILIKAYKDVFSSTKYYGEFSLKSEKYTGSKMIFNYKKDKMELEKIFENVEQLNELNTQYLILIVKEKILGFVSISKPVNDRLYDESLFELIESLSISTYISLNNAMLFDEVKRQKSIIEQKLNTLVKLNRLIKNINSCTDLNELAIITIKTLNIAFGIKKAMFIIKNEESLLIKEHIGFETEILTQKNNENWDDINTYGILYKYSSKENNLYFDQNLLDSIGNSNCLVISPLNIDTHDIVEDISTVGYIVILETGGSLKEEEVLLIDTISSSISPIVNHIKTIEEIKSQYIINPQEAFIKSLNKMYYNKKNFYIDYYIYYKKIEKKPFGDIDFSAYKDYYFYYFDNLLFVTSEIPLDEKLFDGNIEADETEKIIQKIKQIE